MDILDMLKESGITGRLILIPLLLYGIWTVSLRVFSESNNWTTPLEARRRNRVKILDERIQSEQDPDLGVVLESQRSILVFQEATGIMIIPSRRGELIALQQRCAHRFGWQAIKKALPHLEFDDDGHLKRGVSLSARVFMVLFLITTAALVVCAVYVGIFMHAPTTMNETAKFTYSLVQLLTEILFMGFAMLSLQPALPVIRALQLQRWIGPSQARPLPILEPEVGSKERKGS